MKRKTKIILTTAAVITLLTGKRIYNSKVPKKQDQSTKSSEVSNLDYPLVATVYQSNTDSNDIIVKFNDEFYKAKVVRAAKDGEGVLAELNRKAVWRKYGTALCTEVLRSLKEDRLLHPGDPLYDLEPIPGIGDGVLKREYKRRGVYGTKHTLFGGAENLTDRVNQN